MKRRDFLATSAAAATAAIGAPLMLSCNPSAPPETGQATNTPDDFELSELTILQLQQELQSGRYTAEKLVSLYLERIDRIDRNGPGLNSVIEVNPEALELARRTDAERKAGKVRSPLHGIPLLIKDNIDTGDRMVTSAGSLALAGNVATRDAFIVGRLREAGAVLLGKTNLSEWANFRSTRSTSGWSGRGGQTRNPYILDRNPCGSSSGSGVAVSANLCVAAIGTETDGSVVCPSSVNGIVGIKPTLGLWSRSGIIPIAHSQDTAGPMTRSVTDAAVILGLLTGVDERDEATQGAVGMMQQDYTRYLDANGLQGARIGVARKFFGFHEQVDSLMEDAISAMRGKGAEIVDPAEITTLEDIGKYEWDVLLYEFKEDLNKYLAGMPGTVPHRTLQDLIAFNEANREKEMPWFEQTIFRSAQEKGPLTEKAYLSGLENLKKFAGREGIDATLQKYSLDAIIAPTAGPAWNTDWANGDHSTGGSSSPCACAGYPAITVPAGFVYGLPVGITFMGTAWSEPVLIRLAFAFEQSTGHRKRPGFLAKLA